MKLLNSSNYTNYAEFLPPLRQLEAQLAKHHVSFLPTKSDFVEKNLSPPNFSEFSYNHLSKELTPAAFQIAYGLYKQYHAQWFAKQVSLDDNDFHALEARFLRAYASLIRDLHMAAMIKDNAKTAQVFLNPKLDTSHDIDVLLVYADILFGLNLRTNTKRSNEFREKKVNRYSRFDNVHYIDMPLRLGEGKKVGGYLLYTPEHMDYIKNMIFKKTKEIKSNDTDNSNTGS